uniref:(northern house mosquito) hypothetical protein n=1 Tax=Culex pipiens TaxID=7175 RepID=A0A8D8FDE8_CULPI
MRCWRVIRILPSGTRSSCSTARCGVTSTCPAVQGRVPSGQSRRSRPTPACRRTATRRTRAPWGTPRTRAARWTLRTRRPSVGSTRRLRTACVTASTCSTVRPRSKASPALGRWTRIWRTLSRDSSTPRSTRTWSRRSST